MSHFALGPCSSLLSFAMVDIMTMTENTLVEERDYLVSTSDHSPSWRKIRSRAQVRTEAATIEKHYLLACSLV